jgi:hypothetical protein
VSRCEVFVGVGVSVSLTVLEWLAIVGVPARHVSRLDPLVVFRE